MTHQHTPGPWFTEGAGSHLVSAPNYGMIANIRGDLSSAETKANISLIKTAPELLAALECLLAKADIEWGQRGTGGIWPETRNDAREAIAKSRGEKS